MAIQDKTTLKSYFETGDIPTEAQFADLIDTLVALTGSETIAGVKTFSSFPVTPSSAPSTDYQAANKKYVDDNAGGGSDYAPDSTITVQRGATAVESAQGLRDAYAAAKLLTPSGNALAADNRAVVMVPAGRYDFGLGEFVAGEPMAVTTGGSGDYTVSGSLSPDLTGEYSQAGLAFGQPTYMKDGGGGAWLTYNGSVYQLHDSIPPPTTSATAVFQNPFGYEAEGFWEPVNGGSIVDGGRGLQLNAQFVDLVGATGKPEDVVLTSEIVTPSRGTVEQTANDVKISFLTMELDANSIPVSGASETSAYFPTTALAKVVLTDVICYADGGVGMSMRTHIEYAGTYTRVTGGEYAFGGFGTSSGTFTDCIGAFGCFGGDGIANGTFADCVGEQRSFGGDGTASGVFTDCVGELHSFGGGNGTVDAGAVFIRCHGADTHMNTGKTRDCYTAAWVTIDNE